CYITDRHQLPGSESEQRRRLLEKIAEAAQAGVDYVQIREKDSSARELETLAREAVRIGRNFPFDPAREHRKTIVLINSRTDIALACDAGGVQLRANDMVASEVRHICASSKEGGRLRIGVSKRCLGTPPTLTNPFSAVFQNLHPFGEPPQARVVLLGLGDGSSHFFLMRE